MAGLHIFIKMQRDKTTGPGETAIEMLTALEKLGNVELSDMVNEIYDGANIPEDLRMPILMPYPKSQAQENVDYTKQSAKGVTILK